MNLHDPDAVARKTLRRWRLEPVAMVRELLHAEPDPWQAEGLSVFPRVDRIAMKACKGPGKTALLAWLLINFILTRPFPKIGCTSITEANIDTNLWPEIAKWQAQAPLLLELFHWTKTRFELKESPATWFAVKRTWPQSGNAEQQADALAGLHGDYAMWIGDESGSYPQAVMATMEAVLASGIETKVIQSGNPTSLEGPLYRACTIDRKLWYVIEITGDPANPNRSTRIKIDWAQQQIDSFGRENPWVMVNVLGQFPPASLNSLLGVEEVTAAMQRHLRIDQYEHAQKRLGIDVARFGDDRTVLFPRQGKACFRPRVMRHARNTAASVDIATAVIRAKTKWGSELEFMDATGGWAAGAADVLLDAGYPIHNVQFHAPALDRRYANRRAEMWFQMAKAIQNGAALPNLPELVGELTTPTYTFRKGQFVLQDKDLVKVLLGRSPDLADALATTYALPEMPAAALAQLRKSARAVHDGDPYAEDPWN